MAESGKARKTPTKATKVAAPARTATRGRARTAAQPAAEVEQHAVTAAAAVPVKRGPGRPRKNALPAAPAAVAEAAAAVEPVKAAVPRPSSTRPAARAAAAMRGLPDPEAVPDGEDPITEDTAEQQAARDEAQAARAETAEHTFKGRKMLVRLPTDEQLIMYRRLAIQFQDLTRDGAADQLSLEEALRQMDRAVRLVQSVLVEPRDKDWLEDQLLEGEVTLAECTGLLGDAFARLRAKREAEAAATAAANGNRATRRASGSRARLADD